MTHDLAAGSADRGPGLLGSRTGLPDRGVGSPTSSVPVPVARGVLSEPSGAMPTPAGQRTPVRRSRPQHVAGGRSRRLRVALVGSGMIAAVHRRSALLSGAEVIGVLGSRPQRSEEAARRWGLAEAFADIDAVAASTADVVHICSPNATHAPFVEALVAAGKHVVCEKPLGVSLAEAERMTLAAQRAGVIATVPFVYRYHPIVREIRARAQAGEFGAWHLLHGHYLQDWLLSSTSSDWRVDPARGGPSRAFADIGSHWCDLVEWVSGQRLSSLTAAMAVAVPERPRDGAADAAGATITVATEDAATVLFRTTSGVPGALVVSQVSAGRKNRLWFELDGALGSAVFDQENPESFWAGTAEGSRRIVRDPDSGARSSGSAQQARLSYLPAGHGQGYGDCFAAFVADTYAAIEALPPDADAADNGLTGLPTFADGLRAARIVDAVVRSAQTSNWTEIER